jgi:hypothetical protein
MREALPYHHKTTLHCRKTISFWTVSLAASQWLCPSRMDRSKFLLSHYEHLITPNSTPSPQTPFLVTPSYPQHHTCEMKLLPLGWYTMSNWYPRSLAAQFCLSMLFKCCNNNCSRHFLSVHTMNFRTKRYDRQCWMANANATSINSFS